MHPHDLLQYNWHFLNHAAVYSSSTPGVLWELVCFLHTARYHTPPIHIHARCRGTGTTGSIAARVAITRAQRQLAVEAGIHLNIQSFQVFNSVGAVNLKASLNCDAFASNHSADAHYDRASFVGLAWRPPRESLCCGALCMPLLTNNFKLTVLARCSQKYTVLEREISQALLPSASSSTASHECSQNYFASPLHIHYCRKFQRKFSAYIEWIQMLQRKIPSYPMVLHDPALLHAPRNKSLKRKCPKQQICGLDGMEKKRVAILTKILWIWGTQALRRLDCKARA